ncbi:MAG: hypothetical protein ACFFKA_14205, partial [Candidatus Thorarchaeota archaeon]
MDQKFDYLFLIAYLNSRLVKFLFNIKNIYIKRSKTKLEENLPVPNLAQFQGINEKHIISLIKLLLVLTIKMQNKENLDDFTNIESELKIYEKLLEEILINQIKTSIKELDLTKIRKVIDILLFELFHVEQKQIDAIENKYYNF